MINAHRALAVSFSACLRCHRLVPVLCLYITLLFYTPACRTSTAFHHFFVNFFMTKYPDRIALPMLSTNSSSPGRITQKYYPLKALIEISSGSQASFKARKVFRESPYAFKETPYKIVGTLLIVVSETLRDNTVRLVG